MSKFTLRWKPDDPSNAIILAFHGRWFEPLRRRKISVVFRKSGRKKPAPDLMYAYVAKPISAIVAKAPIEKYEYITIEDALRLSTSGDITQQELREYAHERTHLFTYHLGPIHVADPLVTFDTLRSEYGYWPSQSFLPLSGKGVSILDDLGGFHGR